MTDPLTQMCIQWSDGTLHDDMNFDVHFTSGVTSVFDLLFSPDVQPPLKVEYSTNARETVVHSIEGFENVGGRDGPRWFFFVNGVPQFDLDPKNPEISCSDVKVRIYDDGSFDLVNWAYIRRSEIHSFSERLRTR